MADPPTAERVVFGACQHDCPDNCAMVTTVRDGRIVSVKGRHEHPFTHGVLCAKVKSFDKRVYAPDRILHPLRRVGRKGEGKFVRISWDAALDEIAGRLQTVVSEYGSEAVLPCSYLGSQGLVNGLHVGDPFFNRLGATVGERTFCNSGASKAFRMVCGPTGGLDPESFRHAKLIVLWAINIVSTAMHHWRFVNEARKNGARLVVIDPLGSRTARHADWHLRPRPGTDVALALGLIRQIAADDLVDHDYVARHTSGFDDLVKRADAYPPERVAEVTGIDRDDVVALARLYANTQPSAIRTGVALERTRNGPDAVRAIAALPAITGAWRHVGGGMFQHPHGTFPIDRQALTHATRVPEGRRAINLMGLADALLGDLDPPVKALFVYNANPITACADQNRVVEGLAREDLFTVVSEIFPTDVTDHADIVLPATSQLEQLDLMFSWGHFNVALNRPAIDPLGEAVSNAELFRRLARRMGFDEPVFRRSDEEIARQAFDWGAPQLEAISFESLMETGYARLQVGDSALRLPHAEGDFPTPSQRVELATSMAECGGAMLENYRQGYTGSEPAGAVDPLPSYAANETGGRFPFTLLSPKTHQFLNSGYANLAHQAEPAGPQPVWLHPDDANDKGIRDGDRVTVFNDLGRVLTRARVTRDTLPGVVVVPHGYWRKHVPGGQTVNALVAHRPTAIGRGPSVNDTRVDIALFRPE